MKKIITKYSKILALLIVCSAQAMEDPKSFSPKEVEQLCNLPVLDICRQKPENEHCKQICTILNHFQNPPRSKLAALKGPFLPSDHARAILHFQATDLGKIMGWDKDRIDKETNTLFTEMNKLAAEVQQQK